MIDDVARQHPDVGSSSSSAIYPVLRVVEFRRTISRDAPYICVWLYLRFPALTTSLTLNDHTSESPRQRERTRWYYILRRSNTRDRLKRGFRPRALSLPRAALSRARMPDSRYGASTARSSSEFRAFSAKIGNLSLYLISVSRKATWFALIRILRTKLNSQPQAISLVGPLGGQKWNFKYIVKKLFLTLKTLSFQNSEKSEN